MFAAIKTLVYAFIYYIEHKEEYGKIKRENRERKRTNKELLCIVEYSEIARIN